MRPDESKYWDEQAGNRATTMLRDNIWKRERILERLFRETWVGERVLEIGVGTATAAAALQIVTLAAWRYVGTDVSQVFCERAAKHFHLDVRNTDIRNLPPIEGGYTRIIALDSLEHVNPEDRADGYKQIQGVMAPHCRILINMPLEETKHDLRYDHAFDLGDIDRICTATGGRLKRYEEYEATLPTEKRRYGWVVIER